MNKTILLSIGFIVTCGWLASGVSWAAPPFPVPAKGGLPACKAELAVCTGDLDSCDLAFDTCTTDLATCDTDLGTCNTELTETTAKVATCTSDLATCEATVQAFPATGQTSYCYYDGDEIPCAGTGQDGDIQAGATLDYTDTGLTIIDNNTKLEWMKQDDNDLLDPFACDSYPGNLDKDCRFTWDEAFTFVASLNLVNHAGGGWRVPNVRELQSIFNYENFSPAVSAAFDTGCVAGCTVDACSCTAAAGCWSSTSLAIDPSFAWVVVFINGVVGFDDKYFGAVRVRAVRGGLID